MDTHQSYMNKLFSRTSGGVSGAGISDSKSKPGFSGTTEAKHSGAKRPDGDKDLSSKRVVMPPSLRTWMKLGLPQEMIDEQLYSDITKKLLTEAQEQAKELGFKELAGQLSNVIAKCKAGTIGEAKRKRDREIGEGDLVEIFKKPNFIHELDDLDPSKIKRDALREKVTTYLSKRQQKTQFSEPKEDWEQTFTKFFRDEYLKTD